MTQVFTYISLIRRFTIAGLSLLLSVTLHAQSQTHNWADVEGGGEQQIVNLFNEHCGSCHGEDLQGTGLGVALVGRPLKNGDSVNALAKIISDGPPSGLMPAWKTTLSQAQIRSLAIYISEQRLDLKANQFKVDASIQLPSGVVHTNFHDFEVQVVADNLNSLPFAMAQLPDGGILVTEKHIGLLHIDPSGNRHLIKGTPEVLKAGPNMASEGTLDQSTGWILGVALHPDYERNGWVYLSHSELCHDCAREDPASTSTPKLMQSITKNNMPSMTRLVRGRIVDGVWRNEQVIWAAPKSTYTQGWDLLACGVIEFDETHHVYITVGAKQLLNKGIQDLSKPYGKIFRLHDDGRIPEDNPFVNVPGALKGIWSYGHRQPQGIFYDRDRRQLWASEHGPKGGDEINLIRRGGNYGWPLFSLGVYYDGVEVGKEERANMQLDPKDFERPVVDLTPSPAVSNFIIYKGSRFSRWRDHFIVGSLKANEVFRVKVEDGKFVERETLLKNIGRIRDIKQALNGDILVLIEHQSGGRILRLAPVI